MEPMGTIGGGAIVIKKYQASATQSTAGVFLVAADQVSTHLASVAIATAGNSAVTLGTVGVGVDTTGTIGATGTVNADLFISVAVNNLFS